MPAFLKWIETWIENVTFVEPSGGRHTHLIKNYRETQ